MCLDGRYFRPRSLSLQKHMLACCLSGGVSATQTFEWAVSRCVQHMLIQYYLEAFQCSNPYMRTISQRCLQSSRHLCLLFPSA